MKAPRLMIGSMAASLVAGIVLIAFQRDDAAAENIPRYTSALVTRGQINRTVDETGQLAPVSVPVSSQISGLVISVQVDFNNLVKRGDVLARIDPSTYEQKLLQAQADLAAAEALHRQLTLLNTRYKDLLNQDLISQQLYDEAAATLQQSESLLVTHKAAVKNARVDLDRCTITSPIDGVVIYKGVEVGETVVSSTTAPTMFAVSEDPKKMRITTQLKETDVSLVSAGQAVTFTVEAFPNRRFEGRVVQIRNPYTPPENQQISQQNNEASILTYETVIEVDNADMSLRPGFTARVSIVIERRENALVVPIGALRVDLPNTPQGTGSNRTPVVYRMRSEDDRAPEPVSVEVGISNRTHIEILTGLSERDRIVTGISTTQEVQRRSLL